MLQYEKNGFYNVIKLEAMSAVCKWIFDKFLSIFTNVI